MVMAIGQTTIWKFGLEVTRVQELEVPEVFRVLHVGNQGGSLCLWAEVDPQSATTKRTFRIIGTGHPVPVGLEYIGSAVIDPFVWHVFQ